MWRESFRGNTVCNTQLGPCRGQSMAHQRNEKKILMVEKSVHFFQLSDSLG